MLTQEEVERRVEECVFLPQRIYQGPKVASEFEEGVEVYYAYGPRAPKLGRLTAYVYEDCLAIVCRVMDERDYERVSWVICHNCCEILYACRCGDFVSDPEGWRVNFHMQAGPRDRRIVHLVRRPRYSLQALRIGTEDTISVALKLTEDVAALVYQWKIAGCVDDVLVAMGSFARSVTGRPVALLLHDVAEVVVADFGPYFYRQSGVSDWTMEVEKLWTNYRAVKDSLFADKFMKVFNHVVAKCVFAHLGFTDMSKLDELEKKKLRPNMRKCVSFFDATGDLVVFLLKQGRQFMISGDINCFFISSESMTEWFERAKRAKANFEFLGNPEPVNLEVHEYLYDLRKAIQDGNSVVKALGKEGVERRIAFNMVTELETLEKRYLSLAASLTMRRQPLGIVVYGEPGIGKTHITDLLIHFWATRFERSPDTEFRFNHNSEEEYFTNFRSYMYAVVLDDVAQHRPDRVQGVDTTVATIIKIFNNMPFSPPQADLADKGKTPMLCDIGVVTTNVLDMNIPYYYSKSYAVMRRLPFHIEPVVKKEYRRNGTLSLDPDKTDGGLYTDYWDFIVREPKCHENMVGTYEETRRFTCLKDLLGWLGPMADKHYANQKVMVEGSADFSTVTLCGQCRLPVPVCCCVQENLEMQASIDQVEGHAERGIFDDHEEVEPTEWRAGTTSRQGAPRPLNMRLLRNFCRSMMSRHAAQVDPVHVAFYARVHLPALLQLGYSDDWIERDYLQYDAARHREPDRAGGEVVRSSMSLFQRLYCKSAYFRKFVRWTMRWSWVRQTVFYVVDSNMDIVDRGFFTVLGEELNDALGNNPMIVALLGVLTVAFMVRKILSMLQGRSTQTRTTLVGEVPRGAENDDVKNVWVQKEREVTTIDFEAHRATTLEALDKSMKRSCVTFVALWTENGKIMKNQSRAIACGDTLLMNAHAIPRCQFEMTVYPGAVADVSANVKMFVDPFQVLVVKDRDIACVRTKGLPSVFQGKIRGNLVKRSFNGAYNGFYLLRHEDGSLSKLKVANVRKRWFKQTFDRDQIACHVYAGTPERPTAGGECGSPLFLETGYGPVLVGFHSVYDHSANLSMATSFYSEDIDEWAPSDVVEPTQVPVAHAVVQSAVSYYDHHESGVLLYHGELQVPRVRMKSRVEPTEISVQLESVGCVQGLDFTVQFSQPLMHSWRPQQKALREFMAPACGLNEVLVGNAAVVLLNNILKNLPSKELELMHAYPLSVAVNGMPGMAYVDGIKRSTSMGYPYLTTKRKYLVPLDEEPWQDGVSFTPEILEKIEAMLAKYQRGERCHPIFNANLKDEVVTLKKYEAEKTRVFFSCPVDFLCVVRMLFLGFTRVVQRNWKVFHCVVGVNVHSRQWEEVYVHLTQHGSKTMIAGDFAGFDKKFPVAFMRWAFWIIKQICVQSGNYSEEELRVMDCIEADLVNPTVNWFGMLITLCGGEVSGHQLTTIFNCFCCVLYIMYSYGAVYDVAEFFDKVAILSLGDDHVVNVSPDRPCFTHTHIKNVLETAGVGYTMAEKERPSVPYIDISEVTFLKRTFRYHSGVEGIVGPLEKQSIAKMLKMHVVPKACSREEAIAQAMTAASMESFYHGREFFEFVTRTLDNLSVSFELREHQKQFPRLTWDQNLQAFTGRQAAEEICRNQNNPVAASYCELSSLASNENSSVELQSKVTRAFPKVRFYGRVRLSPKKRHTVFECEFALSPDNEQLAESTSGRLTGLKTVDGASAPQPERMTPNDGSENVENMTKEQVEFADEKPYENVDFSGDMDRTVHRPISADLGSFLSRPLKLTQYIWDVNSAAGFKFGYAPWYAYFNNAVIKRKLENFPFIRCVLKVKFILNASPFYYGSMGVFYEPLAGDILSADKLGTSSSYTPGSQVLVSQRKGVYLDPQTSSTAEITLPFLFYRDYLDLVDTYLVQNFGNLLFYQFATLRSANGVVSGGVTINVFAWAEEVELSGTTNRTVLQSKKDEWSEGPISRPASIVAGVARRLKDVPVVGPVALATGVVAGAVRDVASFFGFSNPPVITDTNAFKPVAFHTLASTEQREPINKLSLTAKAETTVGKYPGDPDGDMLAMKNFLGRESFLCGMLWDTTRIEDSILFTSSVTPQLYEFGGAIQPTMFHTPVGFVGRMFDYWRGDLIFTFRIIKSKYHRGRLAISWDPSGTYVTMPAVGVPTVEQVIVDLDETSEVQVRVPYTQAVPFLQQEEFTTATLWSNGSGAPAFQGQPGATSNGTIQVRVLNPLTAPVATSSVDILVYVRAADNFEFAAPTTITQNLSMLKLQSNIHVLGDAQDSDPNTYAEVFGERIVSLRQVLHRQSQAWIWVPNGIPANTAYGIFQLRLQRLPRPYGFTPVGTESINRVLTTGTVPGFIAYNHPLLWITMAFLGYRGSTNYSLNSRGVIANHISVTRASNVYTTNQTERFALLTNTPSSRIFTEMGSNAIAESGASGMVLTNQLTQAGVMVNLPYYNNAKFMVTNIGTLYDISGNNWGSTRDNFVATVKKIRSNNSSQEVIDVLCGSGNDYDCVYFLNCPPCYVIGEITPG